MSVYLCVARRNIPLLPTVSEVITVSLFWSRSIFPHQGAAVCGSTILSRVLFHNAAVQLKISTQSTFCVGGCMQVWQQSISLSSESRPRTEGPTSISQAINHLPPPFPDSSEADLWPFSSQYQWHYFFFHQSFLSYCLLRLGLSQPSLYIYPGFNKRSTKKHRLLQVVQHKM